MVGTKVDSAVSKLPDHSAERCRPRKTNSYRLRIKLMANDEFAHWRESKARLKERLCSATGLKDLNREDWRLHRHLQPWHSGNTVPANTSLWSMCCKRRSMRIEVRGVITLAGAIQHYKVLLRDALAASSMPTRPISRQGKRPLRETSDPSSPTITFPS